MNFSPSREGWEECRTAASAGVGGGMGEVNGGGTVAVFT